ncbi:hypothetical protein JGI14_102814 [Candidatus Kryptonium thompsonii]|uniref:Uncharacterized protein n=1 Tax=Candidatus Kryptonium thompsonii TaxID=1633631 RepID=A0A0P1LV52_9BACT|nr:hypothetical protein JGI13_01154 [Candidatus Kryptonium thompsoni]CUS85852.1 hypothetical protein JGI8_00935 [Candidatus Kryptonium thompsoni]CUS87534.1 hypothetical protein JGI14_102814 [Candidatus Kryptonium thompsoni]CUS91249.1 hypothetical protein JGI15_106511 [Candidatus Kryptonium thompsoni]CUS91582.1 hypothetical protein JGI6_00256 [Candidatus Kryptonium thompsoni]
MRNVISTSSKLKQEITKSVIILWLLISPGILFSSDKGKISGYMFGDYYYVAMNHDSTYKGQKWLLV